MRGHASFPAWKRYGPNNARGLASPRRAPISGQAQDCRQWADMGRKVRTSSSREDRFPSNLLDSRRGRHHASVRASTQDHNCVWDRFWTSSQKSAGDFSNSSNSLARPLLSIATSSRTRLRRCAAGHELSSCPAWMSETRKLAAILVADIVGYSRLAASDENSNSGAAENTSQRSDRPDHRRAS